MGAIGMIPKLFRMGCFSDTVKSDNGSRRFKGGPPGGRWDDFEAIPNGMFFRWRFAPGHPCIAEVGQNRTHFLTYEAEDHLETILFVIEKVSF